MSEKITYELPLSERIRTFLRLEGLFHQMQHFSEHDGEWQNRAELNSLLDILTISSRTDLKNELTKEIERHTKYFAIFAQNPKVDREKLQQSIDTLNQVNLKLMSSNGRIDHVLKQVDLLKCLAQRNSIPGGTCDFDLPAYHYWLNKPLAIRQAHINSWTEHLRPIKKAISLLLQFIRFSATPLSKVAPSGYYQQNLDTTQPVHLLRVSVPLNSSYFAEISGGKHRFTVRFMEPNDSERAIQTSDNIDFTLNICQM